MKHMKKKPWVIIVFAVVLLALLFVPFIRIDYDDGGTTQWVALTYRVVQWKREFSNGMDVDVYENTRVYFGIDYWKSISELWDMEYEEFPMEQDPSRPATGKDSETTSTETEHEHTWSEWKVLSQLTCTTPGDRERYCSCGVFEHEHADTGGHLPGEWTVDVPATADTPGHRHTVCTRCGEPMEETLPAIA